MNSGGLASCPPFGPIRKCTDLTSSIILKLGDCASKSLLYALLSKLLPKSRAQVLPGTVLQGLLDATVHKLALVTDDFRPKSVDQPYSHSYHSHYSNPQVTPGDLYAKSHLVKFANLLGECLLSGFLPQAAELLSLSASTVFEALSKDPEILPASGRGMTGLFIQFLVDMPKTYPLWTPPASLRVLVEVLFRRCVSPISFPVPPPPPLGWTHMRRPCNSPGCLVCPEMNHFLESSQMQHTRFTRPYGDRKHIERQLPPKYFELWTDPTPILGHGKMQTLVVSKLGTEHQEKVEAFHLEWQKLHEKMAPFRQDHVCRLLGDDLFRELILMERQERTTEPHHNTRAVTVTGTKRPAEETLENSVATRMRSDNFVDLSED